MPIERLLSAPPDAETGQALLDWVANLRARILRGDVTIGILPAEEVQRAPLALRKAAACGLAEGWFQLASWHADPPLGAADVPEAENVLREAMAAGVPGAGVHLARLRWFHRRDTATEDEQREAYRLVEAAAAGDPRDAEAIHLRGLLTSEGFGTESDPSAAAALQRQAAALGSLDATFELFVHHYNGVGVPHDEEAALDLLRRAADAGHPRAMYNMGALHATGTLVACDPRAALDWYTRSAEAGNVRATATLAVMYAQGDGCDQDLEYARQLFDEAEHAGLDVSDLRASVGL